MSSIKKNPCRSPHSNLDICPLGDKPHGHFSANSQVIPEETRNGRSLSPQPRSNDELNPPPNSSSNSPLETLSQRVRLLEKENRKLQKKLKRSESDRIYLERNYEVREGMLNQVVQELELAQAEKEHQNQELNQALKQLQAMQGKLVEAEKMSALGVLVAGVAHEINNPISFIHGNVECANEYIRDLVDLIKLYQKHYPDPHAEIIRQHEDMDLAFLLDDVFGLLQSMQVGSDRIREIVLSLRTFSRHDESGFKEADIHQGLDSTLMILQHRLKENGREPAITVRKNYTPLPPIPCFAGQLNQVFMNILSNAIDALRDSHNLSTDNGNNPPEIWIHTEQTSNNMVLIRIGNSGPPIPETVRDRLFEPFFTTKGIGKGTGLGLSISYQIIVEKHYGSLKCVSSPDTGCEFWVEIPLRGSQGMMSAHRHTLNGVGD